MNLRYENERTKPLNLLRFTNIFRSDPDIAVKSAAAVRQALAVFPNGEPPDDYPAFEASVLGLSDEARTRLNELMDEFLESGEDIEQLSHAWLVANRELFAQARS
jgi:hypothetical protein